MSIEKGTRDTVDEGEPLSEEDIMAQKQVRENLLESRDLAREEASDLQRDVSEKQAARYEIALLTLMERTENNSDLVNAMNGFLKALEGCSDLGRPSEGSPLSGKIVERLTKFFEESKEELRPSKIAKGVAI